MQDETQDDDISKLVEQFFDETTMEIIELMKLPPITLEDIIYHPKENDFLEAQAYKAEYAFLNRLREYIDTKENHKILSDVILLRLNQYL